MEKHNVKSGLTTKKKITISALVFLLLAVSGPRLDSDLGKEWIVGEERPLIIAHRGGADIFPENTMVAFEGAAMLGVDVLEMDFHLTSDNYLITMHDSTVDRTTNGTGPVREMTLQQILQLDACLLYTSPSPRDATLSRMPSSA